MVIGGRRQEIATGINTMETFDTDLGFWAISEAILPRNLYALRAANIDDRVLIFGRLLYFIHHTQDIKGT